MERAAPPAPRAVSSQAARTARPQVSPVATSSERLRRLAGLLAARRGAGRGFRGPPLRELAFDLLVRLPERAAVLLGMGPRVVANTSSTPPATLATTAGRRPRRAVPE
ncbi:hypothetical protein A5705_05045 [Mycobacterium sp. E787]|nr:hypothetical protein A5705_05045 [Mycobacterium sp. E787]